MKAFTLSEVLIVLGLGLMLGTALGYALRGDPVFRKEVAVGSCHVHGQSLRDSPCLEGTVDGH